VDTEASGARIRCDECSNWPQSVAKPVAGQTCPFQPRCPTRTEERGHTSAGRIRAPYAQRLPPTRWAVAGRCWRLGAHQLTRQAPANAWWGNPAARAQGGAQPHKHSATLPPLYHSMPVYPHLAPLIGRLAAARTRARTGLIGGGWRHIAPPSHAEDSPGCCLLLHVRLVAEPRGCGPCPPRACPSSLPCCSALLADPLYPCSWALTRTGRGGQTRTTLGLSPPSPRLLMESWPRPGASPSFCLLTRAHFSLIQRAR
jgi:hypothetical protein